MPWYFPWSDSIKKRACRYVLQHYLGQFLQEQLTLDQLTVDLFKGEGIVKDVALDVWALNDLLEGANAPVQILDGFINTISVSVPWSSLMQKNCEVTVKGLELVVSLKKNVDVGGSIISESLLFSSMTTSLQIAQECLKDDEPNNEDEISPQAFDGLESFAQTIESVLSRLKVNFEDVLIRFEHLFSHKRSGIGLELHIKRIQYSDLSSDFTSGDQENFDVYNPPTIANKNLRIYGLKLSLDEFHENSRTVLRNTPLRPEPVSSPESVTSSPPVSPYQSAIFNQSLWMNHLSPQDLLPAVVVLSSAGEQEVNIKWKLNVSCPGPKVECQYFLGTVNILLFPKHLQVLKELLEDICRLQNTDNFVSCKDGVVNKPMKPEDFRRIEKELQEQMNDCQKNQLSKVDLWRADFDNATGSHGECSDSLTNEETFYSLSDNEQHVVEPVVNCISPSLRPQSLVQKVSDAGIFPLINHNCASGGSNNASKLPILNRGLAVVSTLDDDHLSKGQLKFSGLSVTLLLRNPPLHSDISSDSGASKNNTLCLIADRFFEKLSDTTFGGKDVDAMQEIFNNACSQSHLRFLLTTVSISCEQSKSSASQCVNVDITVGMAKLMECLVDDTNSDNVASVTQVLSLSGDENMENMNGNGVRFFKPCLKAKYENVGRSISPASVLGRYNVAPKTAIQIEIGHTEIEIDVTMIDRIHDVLLAFSNGTDQPRPSSQCFPSAPMHTNENEEALFSRTMNDGSSYEHKIDICVQCSNIMALLRFPILDLRPPDTRPCQPLFQKRLHEEICMIRCFEMTFESCLQFGEATAKYEFRFKAIDGYMKKGKEETRFIHVSRKRSDDDDSNGFNLARVVVTVQQHSKSMLEENGSSENSSTDSLSDSCSMFEKEPSPFSSKPHMYDNEELVVPGEPQEMNDFQEKASSTSRLHVELHFPEIDVNLHDASFIELIYNRFANDLLLWEPSRAPVVNKPEYNPTLASNLFDVEIAARLKNKENCQSTFLICGSNDNQDSLSSENSGGRVLETMEKKPATSTFALTLNTSKLRVVLFPCSKFENKDSYSKLLLLFENALLVYVLDYNGEPNLSYIGAQSQKCSLHHAVYVEETRKNMTDAVFEAGEGLNRILFASDEGLKVAGSKTNQENPPHMLAVAVKSSWNSIKNSKDNIVSISLSGSTLHHRMVHEGQWWILQMIEYFGVKDEEVVGFVPPTVVTMLHVHFWDCALYYRPLHIPYQLLVSIEGFSISSNILLDSKVSVLRFIIDNAVLLISNNKEETVDILKDYVSVADVDLLEISIETKNDEDFPKRTITLSNNIVHLRTCSDSLSAIAELLRYIVNSGDFPQSPSLESRQGNNSERLNDVFEETPVTQHTEGENFKDLMSDAMDENLEDAEDKFMDSSPSLEVSQSNAQSNTDVFHFSGESQTSQIFDDETDGNDCLSDDEFCIIESTDVETQVVYQGPEVTSYCDDIKIISDHFETPVGGLDQLKAPDHYPTPLYVYTVKEMSIVWQLFGGSDFQKKQRQTTNCHSSSSDHCRAFHDDDLVEDDPVVIGVHDNKKKYSRTKLNWKTNAGECRDLNTLVEIQLTKARFQCEEYPEEAKQAWRHVLLVQDVEIRDRLSSSQINKFLYQYSTEARPKQRHSNMVSIKMVGLNPEDAIGPKEGCLRVSIKPLRLNIDQSTLLFIINFCKDLWTADDATIQDDEQGSEAPMSACDHNVQGCSSQDMQIFFRLVEFSSDVPIRLDYQGKHDMDMGHRSLAGVLFAFAQLNCSEITLRRFCYRSGLMGFNRVVNYALNEWGNDIKKRQIPGILGGVGPTYSLVQLVQGFKDLFWLPVEQYRRDGRIIRGIQRGASSFTTSSAMAVIEFTNKLVQVVHGAAELAYDVVSPADATVVSGSHGKIVKHRGNSEPADLRQGISNAYNVVTEGFGKTATNIVHVAKEEHESKGMTGAVGGVLRHIPSAVVQPIILATEATSNVLGGVRNQILPDARREAAEKWRVDS